MDSIKQLKIRLRYATEPDIDELVAAIVAEDDACQLIDDIKDAFENSLFWLHAKHVLDLNEKLKCESLLGLFLEQIRLGKIPVDYLSAAKLVVATKNPEFLDYVWQSENRDYTLQPPGHALLAREGFEHLLPYGAEHTCCQNLFLDVVHSRFDKASEKIKSLGAFGGKETLELLAYLESVNNELEEASQKARDEIRSRDAMEYVPATPKGMTRAELAKVVKINKAWRDFEPGYKMFEDWLAFSEEYRAVGKRPSRHDFFASRLPRERKLHERHRKWENRYRKSFEEAGIGLSDFIRLSSSNTDIPSEVLETVLTRE